MPDCKTSQLHGQYNSVFSKENMFFIKPNYNAVYGSFIILHTFTLSLIARSDSY